MGKVDVKKKQSLEVSVVFLSWLFPVFDSDSLLRILTIPVGILIDMVKS